jgi:hypothetical protein
MILTNVDLFKAATNLTIEDLKDFYSKDQYDDDDIGDEINK